MDDRASTTHAQHRRLWRTRSSFERQQQRLQSRAAVAVAETGAASSAAAAAAPAAPSTAAVASAAPSSSMPSTSALVATAVQSAAQSQARWAETVRTVSGGGRGEIAQPVCPAAANRPTAAAQYYQPRRFEAPQLAAGAPALGSDSLTQRLWRAYEKQSAPTEAAAVGARSDAAAAAAAAAQSVPLAAPPATASLGHAFSAQAAAVGGTNAASAYDAGSDAEPSGHYSGGGCLRVRLPVGHHLRRVVMTTTVTAVDERGREKQFSLSYEGEDKDGQLVCREQLSQQQQPALELAPDDGSAPAAARSDCEPAKLPPSAATPLHLHEPSQLLATAPPGPLKHAESNSQVDPAFSSRQTKPDAPPIDNAMSSAAANSEQPLPAKPMSIISVTVTAMQFNMTRRRKSAPPARVRLVCAHLSPSRRCAFVPLADLAQMAMRPDGAQLQADKLEQNYGKFVPTGCLLRITDIERAAEADPDAKVTEGDPCSSANGNASATGLSGGASIGVCSARLDAQSTCSVGRSEPMLTVAGVEALLVRWKPQLKATDKRYPGAEQFVCQLLVDNLRVMQAGPQVALAGQAGAGAIPAILLSKSDSRERQSASVGPAKSSTIKPPSAQSSGRHSAPTLGVSRFQPQASKGSGSARRTHTPCLDEQDESVWEVHQVLDQRTYRRQLQYQIHWLQRDGQPFPLDDPDGVTWEPWKYLDCEEKLEEFRQRRLAESGGSDVAMSTRSSRKPAAFASSEATTPITNADALVETVEEGGQTAERSVNQPLSPSELAVSDSSTQSPKLLTNTPPESTPTPQPRPANQLAEPSRTSDATHQSEPVKPKTASSPGTVNAAPMASGIAVDGRKKKKKKKKRQRERSVSSDQSECDQGAPPAAAASNDELTAPFKPSNASAQKKRKIVPKPRVVSPDADKQGKQHSEAAVIQPASSPPLSRTNASRAASPSVSTPPPLISMSAAARQPNKQSALLGVPPRSPAPRRAKRNTRAPLLQVKRVQANPPNQPELTKPDITTAPANSPAPTAQAEKPKQSSAQLHRQPSIIDLTV